jgi:hypothetical protein
MGNRCAIVPELYLNLPILKIKIGQIGEKNKNDREKYERKNPREVKVTFENLGNKPGRCDRLIYKISFSPKEYMCSEEIK